MARKQQSQMVKTIAPIVGASTLAELENHTTSQAAQAAAPVALKTGKNFTGQYLYDRFIANDKTEITKLDIVRDMARQLDVASYKKLLGDFVSVAKGFADNAAAADKKAGLKEPSMSAAQAAARYKTAQNHQSVMRAAYGAIRFAPDELVAQGYGPDTGYQVVRVMALKALDLKGIKWDGSKIDDKETIDRRKSAKVENKALEAVMETNPRNSNETLAQYLERVGVEVDNMIIAQRVEAQEKLVADLATKFRKDAGSLLDDVIQRLLTTVEVEPALTVKGSAPLAETAVKH